MYQIRLIRQAEKDLDTFPRQMFNRIKAELIKLQQNPRPHGCEKLTQQDGYRIRVGDYRVLYRIEDPSKEIYIYRIKHRKEAYR